MVKVLHDKCVAQLGNVSDAVDIVGKVRAIFNAQSVAPGGDRSSGHSRAIDQRVLVLYVVSLELGHAVIALAVADVRFKSDRWTAAATIIEPDPSFDMIGDGKSYLG